MDLIPAEKGGDDYYLNGGYVKLQDAGKQVSEPASPRAPEKEAGPETEKEPETQPDEKPENRKRGRKQ